MDLGARGSVQKLNVITKLIGNFLSPGNGRKLLQIASFLHLFDTKLNIHIRIVTRRMNNLFGLRQCCRDLDGGASVRITVF